MFYTPKTTFKCCNTCIHIKDCIGCYDGIEYENKNQQELIDYIQEKIERGKLKTVTEIRNKYKIGK